MKHFTTVLAVLLIWAVDLSPAEAMGPAETKAAHWRAEMALRGRINRTGVGTKSSLSYRVPLSASRHILLSGAQAESGLELALSPASVEPALFFRMIPVSPLLLGVSAQHIRWYGTFGNLSHYPGLQPDWSPARLRERGWERNVGQTGSGYRLTAQAMLRLKVGPVVGLFDTLYKWVGAKVPPGTSFIPAAENLLVAHRDLIVTHKADMLYFLAGQPSGKRFFMAGLHWEGHRTRDTQVERQILGGIAGWRTPGPDDWSMTLAGIVGAYTVDPYLEGQLYVGASLALEQTWTDD